MPLPFSLAHINLWALADGEGWTIVDTGISTPETAAAWRQLLPGPLGGKPHRAGDRRAHAPGSHRHGGLADAQVPVPPVDHATSST
jgi:hypothetical protein